MRVLLISTYELGHQPLHVASPATALRRAGHGVRALDLSVDPWAPDQVTWADALAFSVPMHTAMRLALRAARTARALRPDVPICLYGLYAPVSRDHTLGTVADRLLAGEYESALVEWVDGLASGRVAQPASMVGPAAGARGRPRVRCGARTPSGEPAGAGRVGEPCWCRTGASSRAAGT